MSESLASILATPVAGLCSLDASLIARIDAFARSSAPLADRAAAVRHLGSVVMGLDAADSGADLPDADLVRQYLAD